MPALASLAFAAGAAAQSPGGLGTSAEYVLGFIQYVRWPAEDDARTWEVCVAGSVEDATGGYAGKTARGRIVSVRRVARGDAVASCHVLDLTGAAAADAKPLFEAARRLPILTVGHGEAFCSSGGAICLRSREGAGGFEINLTAAQHARLTVGAQLLMLGRRRHVAGSAP